MTTYFDLSRKYDRLPNLLDLACLRTGQILNLSQLGRDAKLTAETTSMYLSLLESSFVISKLSPYLSVRWGTSLIY
jgi:predicted AAA+ superfamily ATPase